MVHGIDTTVVVDVSIAFTYMCNIAAVLRALSSSTSLRSMITTTCLLGSSCSYTALLF